MSFWDGLDARYRVILCDVWGVVHDGVQLYPNAAERLADWREDGRKVILVTNAPRTADAVEAQLGRIGLPRDCWDGIATSGEAGIAALNALERPVGFLGTAGDRAVLEGRSVRIAAGDDFTDLACTGLEPARPDAARLCRRFGTVEVARRGLPLPQSRPAGDARRRGRGLCGGDCRRI